jgi:hypothetical protein
VPRHPRSTFRWLTALGLAALLAPSTSSCGPSKADIDRVIDRGVPLIQAIQAYDSAKGYPPPSLQTLVPGYLSAIPSTGLEDHEFEYMVGGQSTRWLLSVRIGSLGFKHMRFDPGGRHPLPVTPLRDGWVMMDP